MNLLYNLPSDILTQVLGYLKPQDLLVLAEDPVIGQNAFDTLVSATNKGHLDFETTIVLMLRNKHLRFSQVLFLDDNESLLELENMEVSAANILMMIPGQISSYRLDLEERSRFLVDAVNKIDMSIHSYRDLFHRSRLLSRFDNLHFCTDVDKVSSVAKYDNITSMYVDCSNSPQSVSDVDYPGNLESLSLVHAHIQWPLMLSLKSLALEASAIDSMECIPAVEVLSLSQILNPIDLHCLPNSLEELEIDQVWVECCDLSHLHRLRKFAANHIDINSIKLPTSLQELSVSNVILSELPLPFPNLRKLDVSCAQFTHGHVFKFPESLRELSIHGCFSGECQELHLTLPRFLRTFSASKSVHKPSTLNLATSWPYTLEKLHLANVNRYPDISNTSLQKLVLTNTAVLGTPPASLTHLELTNTGTARLMLHNTNIRTLVFAANTPRLRNADVCLPPALTDLRIRDSMKLATIADLDIPPKIRRLELVKLGIKHLGPISFDFLEHLDLSGNVFEDYEKDIAFPANLQSLVLEDCGLGKEASRFVFGPDLQYLSTLPETSLEELPENLAYYNEEHIKPILKVATKRNLAVYGLIILPFASLVIVTQNVLLTAIQGCSVMKYFTKSRLKKVLGKIWRWTRL